MIQRRSRLAIRVNSFVAGAFLVAALSGCGPATKGPTVTGTPGVEPPPTVKVGYSTQQLLPANKVGLAEEAHILGFHVLLPSWLPSGGHLCQVAWNPPPVPHERPPMTAHLMFCGPAGPQGPRWIIMLTEGRGRGAFSGPGVTSVTVDGLVLQEVPQADSATKYIDGIMIDAPNGFTYGGIGAHLPLTTLARVMVSILKPASTP